MAAADDLAAKARSLAALGRTEEARALYLEALAADPTHFAALNDFGVLLHETGFTSAARTVFAQAVASHPDRALGHVNLAGRLMADGELDAARTHFETALRLDPGNAAAHQQLSALLRDLGEADAAEHHRRLGFAAEPVRRLAYLGQGDAIPLIVLTSTPGGDIAWEKLIDRQVFAVTAIAAEFFDGPLPQHGAVFNAIGDVDVSRSDLLAAERLIAGSSAPILNHPAKVLLTGRAENAERLDALPGVVTPKTAILPRSDLEASDAIAALAGHGFSFPLLLRSPGFHTGRHFSRVDHAGDLAAAVAALPGPELMAIEALDARGPDGFARKYRVMMIGGALYPLHLAISPDWKVHYATGAMRDQPGFQAEEARFLADVPGVLGARAMAALAAIQNALGLDYGGADFALGPKGEVLLFEANATMNIIPPDASAQWDYRRPAIEAATAAARTMLVSRASEPAHPARRMPA